MSEEYLKRKATKMAEANGHYFWETFKARRDDRGRVLYYNKNCGGCGRTLNVLLFNVPISGGCIQHKCHRALGDK